MYISDWIITMTYFLDYLLFALIPFDLSLQYDQYLDVTPIKQWHGDNCNQCFSINETLSDIYSQFYTGPLWIPELHLACVWMCLAGWDHHSSFQGIIYFKNTERGNGNGGARFNNIWWLCLVPTSTTRFASDVGTEWPKFNMAIQGR